MDYLNNLDSGPGRAIFDHNVASHRDTVELKC